MPDSTESNVETAGERIKQAVENYNAQNHDLPLSMSVGFAVGQARESRINQVFIEADNNMYREKLHRKHSARSNIVQTLMETLKARDFVTEEHVARSQKLIEEIGLAIGMRQNRLTDLRLLARFHDIGKVSIPDRILLKPSVLTPEEFNEMKRHCQVGHQIAISMPELVSIADWILKHHEWWNGTGYPFGLSEKEIPVGCRILAIVDAYDAMTNDRPYRKAMSSEKALAEIVKCAGIQFDSELVKIFTEVINNKL